MRTEKTDWGVGVEDNKRTFTRVWVTIGSLQCEKTPPGTPMENEIHTQNPQRIKRKFWKISERKRAVCEGKRWEQHQVLSSSSVSGKLAGEGFKVWGSRISTQAVNQMWEWPSFACTGSGSTVLTQDIFQEATGGDTSPNKGENQKRRLDWANRVPTWGSQGPQDHRGGEQQYGEQPVYTRCKCSPFSLKSTKD